jgi:hypothetical protein
LAAFFFEAFFVAAFLAAFFLATVRPPNNRFWPAQLNRPGWGGRPKLQLAAHVSSEPWPVTMTNLPCSRDNFLLRDLFNRRSLSVNPNLVVHLTTSDPTTLTYVSEWSEFCKHNFILTRCFCSAQSHDHSLRSRVEQERARMAHGCFMVMLPSHHPCDPS